MNSPLTTQVLDFAQKTSDLPEHILNNEGWGWDAYEGIRYGLLHVALELRTLAATLADQRTRSDRPIHLAQRMLAQHHLAFRDFQSLLLGLSDQEFDREPAAEEWSIRTIITHVHGAERYFFAHILNALDNPNPQPLNNEQMAAILGGPRSVATQGSLQALWADYETSHSRVLTQLSQITNDELNLLSPMWEPAPVPIHFRIQRFGAHIREHTNQLEKTLTMLDRRPSESKQLLRQVYVALAEVEGTLIGAEDFGADACAEVVETIKTRSAAMFEGVTQAHAMLNALKSDDTQTVKHMLAVNPALMSTKLEDGLSALVYSKYRGQAEVVDALLATGRELSFFEASMVGNLDELNAWLTYRPEVLHSYARDGYTGLQLACFFAHPTLAQRLLEAGADVHAVAKNEMRIQPLHAAVAGRNLEIVEMLLAAGADVNAKQQGDFTPLMAAVQNGDAQMVAVLRAAGAGEG